MVQILTPQSRERPSFAQSILGGISEGIPGALESYQKGQQLKGQQQQQNQTLQQLTGQDLSGLDPDSQKAALSAFLKQQGDERLLDKKQGFLDQIFNDKSQTESNQSNNKESKSKQFEPESLSDEDISRAAAINPALGNSLRQAKDSSMKQKQALRKEEIEFHKETQKYDEDLLKNTRIAKNQQETIKSIGKAIDSGNVKPGSWANIFKGFGTIGDKLSNAILNSDEATLQASIPALLEGWKEVFGVRLSDADLRVLQDKLPDIGKSPDVNKSILKIMSKYSEMTLLRQKIASEIKKNNKGLRPLGYVEQIEERFDEMQKPVKVINPRTGNTIEIPAHKVSDAINSGARLANE